MKTATSFPLPDAVLDDDIAILGRKGGGKTVTAKGIVEHLLRLKRRVLILTPLPGWEGLRTKADGSAGFPIAIIGGERADYPLDLALAKPLAEVLARENVPAIVDLSDETKSKQQRFLLDFLHTFRTVNREAITVVLEEADAFAPQNPLGDDSKALHAEIDWIARRARARGIRLITVCQRPARLAKDVLTQASVLIAHVLPSSHDRAAVKAWVDGNGDPEKAREVFNTLASLKRGEAWIWSTVEHQSFLKRAQFPMITTLDVTATPKAGAKRIEQKTLADVDVTAIKAALEKAKAPKAPRNHGPGPEHMRSDGKNLKPVPVDVHARLLHGRQLEAREAAMVERENNLREAARACDESMAAFRFAVAKVERTFREWHQSTGDMLKQISMPVLRMTAKASAKRNGADLVPDVSDPNETLKLMRRESAVAHRFDQSGLSGAASKMLAVLDTDPPVSRTWSQVATLAGIKARGGHFNTGKRSLLESGLVDVSGDRVRIGFPTAGAKSAEVDPAALVEQWKRVLSGAAPKMLQYLADAAHPMTRVQLADGLGVQPRGGHWNSAMKELRDNDVIRFQDDKIALSPLFGGPEQ